jgi:hypothetical protein
MSQLASFLDDDTLVAGLIRPISIELTKMDPRHCCPKSTVFEDTMCPLETDRLSDTLTALLPVAKTHAAEFEQLGQALLDAGIDLGRDAHELVSVDSCRREELQTVVDELVEQATALVSHQTRRHLSRRGWGAYAFGLSAAVLVIGPFGLLIGACAIAVAEVSRRTPEESRTEQSYYSSMAGDHYHG